MNENNNLNITKKDLNRFFRHCIIKHFKTRIDKFLKINPQNSKRINHRKLLNETDGNNLIGDFLNQKSPFFISRFGSVECDIMANYHLLKIKRIDCYDKRLIKESKMNAGMFSNNEIGFETFSRYCKNAISQMDACGYWFLPHDNILYKIYGKRNLQYFKLMGLESYLYENPWTKCLEGKKVLVVSSYAKTIESQYKKRELLFKNKDTLPDFTLITYTPVISSGNNVVKYKTWEEALLKMRDDILKLDFDVALLSCGSYGMPLGGLLRSEGKSVIHVGGCLQMIFGIKGNRWDVKDYSDKYYNKHWVRSNENKPKDADLIEEACYW